MFLSIVIPVYKTEKYLRQCLDSCLDQDISSDEYEIICVDDGSPDGSGQIIDEYSEKHANVIALHKENGGVSSARNAGINIARGEYIWFIDSDDYILDNILGTLFNASLTKPDMIQIKTITFYEGEKIGREPKENRSTHIFRNNMTTKLFLLETIKTNGIRFNESMYLVEDDIFYHDFDKFVSDTVKINRIVYFYRIRSESAVTTPAGLKLDKLIQSSKTAMDLYIDSQRTDEFLLYEIKSLMSQVMFQIADMKRKDAKRYIEQLRSLRLFPIKGSTKRKPNRKFKLTRKEIRKRLVNNSYSVIGYNILRLAMLPVKAIRKISGKS